MTMEAIKAGPRKGITPAQARSLSPPLQYVMGGDMVAVSFTCILAMLTAPALLLASAVDPAEREAQFRPT